MISKHTIRIHKNGDVSYYFYRDKPLQYYLIEWPHEQVTIMDEDNIRVGGYARSITSQGYLQLSWATPTIHEFTYKKVQKAAGLGSERLLDEGLRGGLHTVDDLLSRRNLGDVRVLAEQALEVAPGRRDGKASGPGHEVEKGFLLDGVHVACDEFPVHQGVESPLTVFPLP